MKPTTSHFARLFPVCGIAIMVSAMAVTLVGCGSKHDPEVVTPPSPSIDLKNGEPTTEPPGSIELPEGDITTGDASPPSGGFEMPGESALSPPTSSPPESIVSYATWEEVQATATSTGKITVLDIWSLVCEPCVKEFPGLVKLHESMGDEIACLSLAIDYDGRKSKPPETYGPNVTTFLTANKASFANFISRTPSDDVYAAADLDSIPAVLIFDASGALVKKFVDTGEAGGFTYEKDIVPLVKSLLQP